MKDYHYILGVPKTATKAEIKKAYRKLSKKFHPDVNDGDEFFADRFKDIQEAYEALSAGKDQPGKAPQPPPREKEWIAIPEIVLFEVSKHEVEIGEDLIVRWRVRGANGVHISLLGSVAGSGEQKINPAVAPVDERLILTATNQVGQTTKFLKLSVRTPAAASASAATPQKSNVLLWIAALLFLCLAGGGAWALYENNAANQRFEESRRWRANVDRQIQAERERMARLSREPAVSFLDEDGTPPRPAASYPAATAPPNEPPNVN